MPEEEPKVQPDAFGTPRLPDGEVADQAPKQPEFVEVNGAKFVNDGTGKAKIDDKSNPLPYVAPKKEGETDPNDIDNNPVVKELRSQLGKSEKDRESMGKSLSEQRKTFEERLKKIEEAGNKPNIEPVFKEVKRVKDLSKTDQEAMTDTEKVLFDKNADLMESINKIQADRVTETQQQKTEREAAELKAKEEREADEADDAFNDDVQERVSKLTGNDRAMSNQVIEKFNQFKDNHLLEGDDLDARILEAAKLVPEYKAPKQQQTIPSDGGAVKSSGTGDDPFGTSKIIKEAKSTANGQTYSL